MDDFESIVRKHTIPDFLHLGSRAIGSVQNGITIVDACDPELPIIFANAAFCALTGYALDEILGKNCRFLQNDDREQLELATLREALSTHRDVRVVVRNYRKDGTLFWNDLFVSPVMDKNGKVTHLIGIQSDVSALKRAQQLLAFQATHDTLTRLPNRQLISQHLTHAIEHTDSTKHIVALLVLDIDHFKLINNRLEFDEADGLLKLVGQRLAECVKNNHSVSRNSADEFAIMLKDIDSAADVSAMCEKIAHCVAAPFLIRDLVFHVTCSIGIALFPQDGGDATTLFRYADMALYRAKDLGRNNWQFFANEMQERALERITLETELRSALELGQICLHYQPLVDLQSGQLSSFEALARWEHPTLGMVPPTRFIAVAEECGLIAQIGEWVLNRACADMRDWAECGFADVKVAINVSPKQFRDPLLSDKVVAALANAGIDARMLSLEITENVLMQDTPASEATLNRLKEMGLDLVLDDFGTGFSSLSYLKRFPFHKVKIDCSFVENIVTNVDDAALSKAIISMAHSLGIRVVAEGVETEAQCDFLRRNMCDEIQGFLFSQALDAAAVKAFLLEERRLPGHLLRMQKPPRTLLLVDDEVNIVAALKRLLRRDNYNILTANSGQEGLDVLALNEVDVIVSDQRMPGMTGVEFLGKAKEIYPDTIRIVLSGYTELQSVTDAVNEGAIYKFLTKPWDDTQLRGHVDEAFRRKEMADENQRLNLEVRTANHELATANRQLEGLLKLKQQQISRDEVSLEVVREALQHVPLPVIGLDEDDIVVFINAAAQMLFKGSGPLLGCDARLLMPELLYGNTNTKMDITGKRIVTLNDLTYEVTSHEMGRGSQSRGRLMTLAQIAGGSDGQ